MLFPKQRGFPFCWPSLIFHLKDQVLDPKGRFLFLKDTWKGKPVTLANVYCPNSKKVTFLKEILLKLASF